MYLQPKDYSLKPEPEVTEHHRDHEDAVPRSVHGIESTEEYEQQRKEYEGLWQSRPDNQAPAPAADSPEKKGAVTNKDLKARFQRLVGAEAFISESKLKSIKTVGSGSFATVDICTMNVGDVQNPDYRQVAVKRLKPHSGIGMNDLASEARILAKLKHRNIVEYIGVGYKEDRQTAIDPAAGCYLVQEYIAGGTLKQKILSRPPMGKRAYTYTDAIHWCCDIAEGLTYLHGVNPVVLHRDLKSENILLKNGSREEAMICDFGLAVSVLNPSLQRRRSQLNTTKSLHHLFPNEPLAAKATMKNLPTDIKRQKSKALDKQLSSFVASGRKSLGSKPDAHPPNRPPEAIYDLTGGTGSYCYMAPEITLCKPYNEKVDCFSFAVIMWEVFQHTTTSSIVLQGGDYDACALYAHKVAEGYRQPLPHRWPAELCDLISECWAQSARDRPPMKAIKERLDKLRDSGQCDSWDNRVFGLGKVSSDCGCSIC